MEEIVINKLSEFMEYVENLPREFILSRGQSNAKYELLPGALRLDENNNLKHTRQSIAYFLNEFKVNSHNYIDIPWDINNDYEWMVYAQHYGIPTRLLDFTNSHIISLMFAVEKAFEDEIDSVVWFLNPMNLNNTNCNRSEIITLSEREVSRLDDYNGPIAIQGRKLNKRINAQNGVFVYFQDRSLPLNKSINDEGTLRKVIIKGESKKDILVSLYSMGIGMTQIYPELSSVAKDILMRDNIKQYLMEEA
ncbi:FRG domain-containing protein [Paraclostridium bifermentans]|uniref:FRG domain-containing protein n=1 Tax=Paraclostridium bifermentans TaxID=1490 RepID=UPI001FF528BA|nr:FRG domain-containing protein [Paraclostridium bifermentans]UOW67891.1 FRG domain-containing protein [Paraclostridium bifermentans]